MEYYLQDRDDSGLHGTQTSHKKAHLGEKLERAIDCHRKGRLGSARRSYLQILQLEPNHYDANRLLGQIAHKEGDLANAAELIARAILSASHLPLAHQDLGNVLFASGRFEEAGVCYRDALNIDPDLAESYVGMARVLHLHGQSPEAVEACNQALKLKPDCAKAYYFLGSYHRQRNELEEAVRTYRKAIKIHPDSTGCSNLGLIYMEQGYVEKAQTVFKQAIRIDPGNKLGYINLSTLYWELNHASKAVRLLENAVQNIPNDPTLLCIYASVLISLNDLSRAEEICRRALALEPGCASAYVQLARLGVEQFSADDLIQLTALAEDAAIPVEEKARIHFALASSHKDIGDYQQEFYHLQIGNKLKKDSQNYSFSEEIDCIKKIGKCFNHQFIEQRIQFGLQTQTPIFIVGMPRSGTSVTEQILASHPDVYGGGEQRHLNDLINQFALKHKSYGMEGFLHHLALTRSDDFTSAGKRYLKLIGANGRRERYSTDKMTENFKNIGLIHLMFPNARIIHCSRHPVATCFSCYSSSFSSSLEYTCDLEDLGLYYLAYRELMDHWHDLLPGKIHEVNYEDLVTDQEQVTRDLLEFCQLDWHQNCLSFYKNERAVLTASHAQVRQPLYSSSLDRWKHYEEGLQPLIQVLKTGIEI